jgi:hypothetical protein
MIERTLDDDWAHAARAMARYEGAADAARPAATARATHAQPGDLSVRSIKVTMVVEAAAVLAIPTPDGVARCPIRIVSPGRMLEATVNAKSVRRATTAIRAAGTEAVVCLIQAKLGAGDSLEDTGLSVQAKGPRPQTAETTA